jgi:hypothetical protein
MIPRIVFAALVLYALMFMLLAACYVVEVQEEEDWRLWPRRGAVPLASADCMTDACLQHREYILESHLGPHDERGE